MKKPFLYVFFFFSRYCSVTTLNIIKIHVNGSTENTNNLFFLSTFFFFCLSASFQPRPRRSFHVACASCKCVVSFFIFFFNYLSAENWSMSKRVKQRPMLYPFHCWAAITKYSGIDVACREETLTETCIAVSLLSQCISIIKNDYLSNLYRKVWIPCDSK